MIQHSVYGENERFRELDRRERFWKGLQYDHCVYTFDSRPRAEVPFDMVILPREKGVPWDKRYPESQSGLCEQIVSRFTNMLFGKGRRPVVSYPGDLDTTMWIEGFMEQSEFWEVAQEARDYGGGMGTVFTSVKVVNNKFRVNVHNPKHFPEHLIVWADEEACEIEVAVELYQFPREEWNKERGGYVTRWYWYRREFTPEAEIWYEPKPVSRNPGEVPTWGQGDIDEDNTVYHNLGFTPIFVTKNHRSDEFDGVPDFLGIEGKVGAADRIMSQMDYSLYKNLEPTLVGAWDDEDRGGYDSDGRPALKKGSDNALLVGEGGNAFYLEAAMTSHDHGRAQADRHEKTALRQAHCVLADPDKITGLGQGSDTMRYLYEMMLAQCDRLREQWGKWVKTCVKFAVMTARVVDVELPPKVVHSFEEDGKGNRRKTTSLEQRVLGDAVYCVLEWGPYFEETQGDKAARVTAAASAQSSNLVSRRTATKFVARTFNVTDVDQELADIEEDKSSQAEADMERYGFGKPTDGPPRPSQPGVEEPDRDVAGKTPVGSETPDEK